MILVSLILASQTFVLPRSDSDLQQLRDSLLIVGGAVVALVLFSFVFRRYLPNAPILSRLMLPATDARQRQQRRDESSFDGSQLLGQIGRTTTQLTPSGKASFANELVDVISDAELIPEGTDVEVVEVHGGHVLVRAVES
jgi:membrane-bound serine protease (ClpP class)